MSQLGRPVLHPGLDQVPTWQVKMSAVSSDLPCVGIESPASTQVKKLANAHNILTHSRPRPYRAGFVLMVENDTTL
jgi:hypothetical protein